MKTTAPDQLPASVAQYLDAANRFDAAAAADCFSLGAAVFDEDRQFCGRAAIQRWIADTSRKYQPRFTVMQATVFGDVVRMAVAIAGQFPGSPVTLEYLLRLRGGKISSLTIE